jgi:outer membrane protein assembly factor BamB
LFVFNQPYEEGEKMKEARRTKVFFTLLVVFILAVGLSLGEDWIQFKYDSCRTGNVPERDVTTPLGLVGAVPLTDAIFTSPVVSAGKVYVVDGAGILFCIDANTLEVKWKFTPRGGAANCNNVCSPAVAGDYIHYGTMVGLYYVINKETGVLVKEIPCGEPIFGAPAVANNRVYFATLGARLYALEFNGEICWELEVTEVIDNQTLNQWVKDRWEGSGRLANRRNGELMFWCPKSVAVKGEMVVVSAGVIVLWVKDKGSFGEVDSYYYDHGISGYGIAIKEEGGKIVVYRQNVETHSPALTKLIPVAKKMIGYEKYEYPNRIRGTITSYHDALPALGFSSPSLRGEDLYRTTIHEDKGLRKHPNGRGPRRLGGGPAVASPILLRDQGVYGGVDGKLYVVSLSRAGQVWSFETAFGAGIVAPVAVCDGRIYFGCEDGYLYILGPGGNAPLPTQRVPVEVVRTPLGGRYTDARYDWYASTANFGNTGGVSGQGIEPPFKIKWIYRHHMLRAGACFGDNRVYVNNGNGFVYALEAETGRFLWERFFPWVTLSDTNISYYQGRVLFAQRKPVKNEVVVRCLEATTGKTQWEHSIKVPHYRRFRLRIPSPPVVYKNLVIYGTERKKGPIIKAWNLETGRDVWSFDVADELQINFAQTDTTSASFCLLDNLFYYSVSYGSMGVTFALNLDTRTVEWQTSEYRVNSNGQVSGYKGRIYVAPGFRGAHPPACLDAKSGNYIDSLSVPYARLGVRINEKYLYAGDGGVLFDRETLRRIGGGGQTACNSPTLAGDYVLSSQTRIIRVAGGGGVVYSGPCIDHVWCHHGITSNGRILYLPTTGGNYLLYLVAGEEARNFTTPWLATSIGISQPRVGIELEIKFSYPNPLNPECYIPIDVKGRVKNARCKIYNILGQLVREIEISNLSSQVPKSVYWDGRDSQGLEVPAGIYFYEIGEEKVRRMVVLR